MLITCPTCASAYRIDAEKLGMEGRSVRCAACRETWFITPADVLAAHAAELEAEDESPPDPASDTAWAEAAAAVRSAAEEAPAEPPVRRSARRPAGGGKGGGKRARGRRPGTSSRRWPIPGLSPALALGLAGLAALPLACLARAGVVRALPQTASLYAGVGLPVNLRGIEIRDVAAFANPAEDGRPAELVVEGDLVGVGRSDVPVPALTVEIRDAAGHVLRTFPVPPPRAVLGAGEAARFRASLVDPPGQGRAVERRFADAAGAGRDAARH